jgi:GH35 family endo-1,4-beta-xylanase
LGANGFLIRGGGVRRPARPSNEALAQQYEQTFARALNYATLPFYWGGYEAAAGQESGDRLRDMATWCRDHGVRTKGHPLAWHEVFPKWAEALPDGDVLRRLRDRIGRIVGEFRGLIDTWDVFNETTVAARFDNAVGRWVKDRGAAECVAEALRLARAANPEAELLYNDFNVSPAFEALVGHLQAGGAPFDAIGIQSHMHKGAWSAEKLWTTCETYARFGLPLHFTETTILSGRLKGDDDNDWHRRHTDWTTTPDGEQRQLEEGRRFYTLLFSHPAVEAVTWWDFSDRNAWQGAPAGLLRNDMSPKPLAEWLGEAFGERWTTRAETRADEAGTACFRGFFGVYTVRAVTENGMSLAGTCAFPRRGQREVEVVLD